MEIPRRINWASVFILFVGSFAAAVGGIRLGLESLVLSLSFSLAIIFLYQIYEIRKIDERSTEWPTERSIVRYAYDRNGRLTEISLCIVEPDQSTIETCHDSDGYLTEVGITKLLPAKETLRATFAAALKKNQSEVDDIILRYRRCSDEMVTHISGIANSHERNRVKYTQERFADRMKKKRLRKLR